MGLFRFILRKAVPLPRLNDYQRFLFIGPHPDDIEIGAGATVAKLSAMGKDVKFLVCTDGRYGIDKEGVDTAKVVAIRQEEAKNAANLLGVKEIEFLPYPDGGGYDVKQLTDSIIKAICLYQPDIIFAPDSKVISELHIDHVNVGESAGFAFLASTIGKQMRENNLNKSNVSAIAYYFTDKPNTTYKINSKHCKLQHNAIKQHISQFPEDSKEFMGIKLYISLRQIRYGITSLKGRADCFRVLGLVHSHCAPESAKF
ncbi:PIG-L family deacetylase [bacterium]|nr:PIG-L family deacetylase [bacterium]